MEPKIKLRIVNDTKDYSKKNDNTPTKADVPTTTVPKRIIKDTAKITTSKPNIQTTKPTNTLNEKTITKPPVRSNNYKPTTRKPIRNTNYKPTSQRTVSGNPYKQLSRRPVKTNLPTRKPTLKKAKSQTTYAFIDSQNLNLGVKTQGWKLDFIKFRKYLKDELNVEKAYIFIGHVAGNQNLYINLQEYGYILVFKPTTDHQEGDTYVTKGNVDTELVLHAMVNIDKYDKAVIVTGDGDFFCLVDYLTSKKKLGKLVVPNSKYSPLFKYFTKDILNIQDIKSKVKLVRK